MTRKKYDYYFDREDADGYFHNNKNCDLLDSVWGDMTETAALDAMKAEDDYDACPECVDL